MPILRQSALRGVEIVGRGKLAFWVALGLATPVCFVRSQESQLAVPATESFSLQNSAQSLPLRWTVAELTSVRRVISIATSEDGEYAAFALRQSDVQSNKVRYELYVAPTRSPGPARKLLEGHFIGDLSIHPRTNLWTVSADLGEGTKLYDIDSSGKTSTLVATDSTADVGTWEGVVGGLDPPHLEGIGSFEWAPDGSALWYSKLRLRSEKQRDAYTDRGIVYDDLTMSALATRNHPGLMAGTELRLFSPKTLADKLLRFVPYSATTNFGTFVRENTHWTLNSRAIRYETTLPEQDGSWKTSAETLDALTGESTTSAHDEEPLGSVESPDGHSHFQLVPAGASAPSRLLWVLDHGEKIDYGAVPFYGIGRGSGAAAWAGARRGQVILAVRYPDHDGLVTLDRRNGRWAAVAANGSIHHCSFAIGGNRGVCVLETLVRPPELVTVDPHAAIVRPLLKVNAVYDRIPKLRYEQATWTNSYGSPNNGFIIYPERYATGKRYPAIIVTHGTSARNEFASRDFQWDFPVQLWPEAGYFVIAVNEPLKAAAKRATFQSTLASATISEVRETQRQIGLEAVASVRAALADVVRRGLVDPERVGIAGYSRGAEVVAYAMTQTTDFKAASSAEGNPSNGQYWAVGSRLGAQWLKALYGGSPFDANPEVLENYRRFSPSFRATLFAGPLLQEVASASIVGALELDRFLKDASVATELVYYPNESHIFWKPSHRISVMQRNLDWFDFWLKGHEDLSPEKHDQYVRWEGLCDTQIANHVDRPQFCVPTAH